MVKIYSSQQSTKNMNWTSYTKMATLYWYWTCRKKIIKYRSVLSDLWLSSIIKECPDSSLRMMSWSKSCCWLAKKLTKSLTRKGLIWSWRKSILMHSNLSFLIQLFLSLTSCPNIVMRFTSDTQQLNLRITQQFISYLFSRKTILIKRYKAWAWFFKKFLMIPPNCFGMN